MDPSHAGIPTVVDVEAGAGMRIEPAIAAGPSTDVTEGGAPMEEPHLDLSISCLSTDPLPRMPAPDHPLASWCYVWKRISGRSYLVRQEYLDIRKSDFFDRRVMVSRKRTRNLGDLFNTWKHSIEQLPEEKAIDLTLSDVNDFD
jgi:hypothetical protein